jgi:hypothetical protein
MSRHRHQSRRFLQFHLPLEKEQNRFHHYYLLPQS